MIPDICSMYILLASATTFEIQPTIDALAAHPGSGSHRIDTLITGVGSIATLWSLLRQIDRNRPDLIIQAGIAGSFRDPKPGEVFVVGTDQFADIGVWEEGGFKTLFDMQLADGNSAPFKNGWLTNPYRNLMTLTGLEAVGALTVNEITTSPERVDWYQQNTPAVVESMEGASLHYVCLRERVPFLQFRSVSNRVGVRDKTQWDIRGAIGRLNERLAILLEKLENPELEKEILAEP